MSDPTQAQRLGRRFGALLLEQRLFAWSHFALAIVAGLLCVLTAMVTYKFGARGAWPRGSGFFLLLAFIAASFPFMISYRVLASRVAEEPSRALAFLAFVFVTSIAADATTVAVIQSTHSRYWVLLVFYSQTIAYVNVGQILLGEDGTV